MLRARHQLFLWIFCSMLAISLFVVLVLMYSGNFALPLAFPPLVLLTFLLVFVLVLTWGVAAFWRLVSSKDFAYRDYFFVFQRYWKIIGIPALILIGLEGFKLFISTLLGNNVLSYFLSVCLINFLCMLICLGHKQDVGRTLAQLYLFDFLNQVFWLGGHLAIPAGPLGSAQDFVCRSVLIGLDFSKIVAVLTMLTLPKQQGWPALIPWVRWRRDNPSTADYDSLIRLTFGALMLIGMWFSWRDVSYESFVYITPVIALIIIIFRKQSNTVETEIGTVSLEFLKVARDVDRITDEEYRLAVMEMVAYNTNLLVTGWVEKDQIRQDKEGLAAAKLAKNGPKT